MQIESEGLPREFILLVHQTQFWSLKDELIVFLQSLPVGCRFNICKFNFSFEFLFNERSVKYDQASLEKAISYL